MEVFIFRVFVLLGVFIGVVRPLLSTYDSNPENLLLFVAITSGRAHAHLREAARKTWLRPCVESPGCHYKFFVDCPDSKMTPELIQENEFNLDLVFRSNCSLMSMHPDDIHYGNSPPTTTNLEGTSSYPRRVFYKIDWKMCFLRWASEARKLAEYIVFVEDDSFMCTENLLHQVQLLAQMSPSKRGLPFRTGTPMYDGFDDSTTFMSKEVALAFLEHYMEPGLNCSIVTDSQDPLIEQKMQWLSWGNSWIYSHCNWRGDLADNFGFHFNVPAINCMIYTQFHPYSEFNITFNSTSRIPLNFPCREHPLIFHHSKAGEILEKESSELLRPHMCEYMLLIDKIKDANTIQNLWLQSTGKDYLDFTPVFTHDGLEGWGEVMQRFVHDWRRKACSIDPNSVSCLSGVVSRHLRSNTQITSAVEVSGNLLFSFHGKVLQRRKRSLRK